MVAAWGPVDAPDWQTHRLKPGAMVAVTAFAGTWRGLRPGACPVRVFDDRARSVSE